MPAEFLLDADRILDFPVRPDDVWLVTFPKSDYPLALVILPANEGTTWTQELVWLLMNDLDFETAKEVCITKRFPYLEHASLTPRAARDRAPDSVRQAAEQAPPRLVKSHLPPQLLPRQLWTVRPKIIYVARSPKDAATSFYYHNCLIHGLTLSLDEYLECFLADAVPFTPYWTNVLGFWKLRNEPNILWNTYEEMKQDLGAVIRKTAAFLGREVTAEQVRQLEHHLSFASMRNNPATNYSGVVQASRQRLHLPPPPSDLSFMREGKVGAARQRMSEEMDRRFDRWIDDHVRDTGYDGPV